MKRDGFVASLRHFKQVSRSLNLLVSTRSGCVIFAQNKFGFSAQYPPAKIRNVQARSCSLPNHSPFWRRKNILSEPGN
jgi:ABC-type arginine transport system ATPase subunit